jgi:hypothetical protein
MLDLQTLIAQAVAEVIEEGKQAARELASPTGDKAERSNTKSVHASFTAALDPLPSGAKDERLSRQIHEQISTRRMELEKRRAMRRR